MSATRSPKDSGGLIIRSGAVLEIGPSDPEMQWNVDAGRVSSFELTLTNASAEGLDVFLGVDDFAEWAWVEPAQLSLAPDSQAVATINFAPYARIGVAAGRHEAVVIVRDFEGTIYGQLVHPLEVSECHELSMSLAVRGPLMKFGAAHGFVLRCGLVNTGNAACEATATGDPHPALTFYPRIVRVPFQGDVSFDFNVEWDASRPSHHPDAVVVRAPYPGGEARASIEWGPIAAALEAYMPASSRDEDDGFPAVLSWMQTPERTYPDDGWPAAFPEPLEPIRNAEADEASAPAPPAAAAPPPLRRERYAYADHVHWLPAASLSRPFIALLLLTAPTAIALGLLTPRQPMVAQQSLVAWRPLRHNVSVEGSRQRLASVESGMVWQGKVERVDGDGIAVYSQDRGTRTFVVDSKLKVVFDGGSAAYPRDAVKPGVVVRVYYQYTKDDRARANAIVLLRRAPGE